MNRCKCGKITANPLFCSDLCQEAYEKKEFGTYVISVNLILSAPSDLEIVKRAIQITDHLKETEVQSAVFDKIVELTSYRMKTRDIVSRPVNIETHVNHLINKTEDNE
jgi:hypothetical protein